MSNDFFETCRQYEKIINQSGIELSSRDQLGNNFDLNSFELAVFVAILTRKDLSDFEKTIMLYGIIHSPLKSNISKSVA